MRNLCITQKLKREDPPQTRVAPTNRRTARCNKMGKESACLPLLRSSGLHHPCGHLQVPQASSTGSSASQSRPQLSNKAWSRAPQGAPGPPPAPGCSASPAHAYCSAFTRLTLQMSTVNLHSKPCLHSISSSSEL